MTPRAIALIGASHDETKLGGIILKNLLKFRGKVYPVNPKYREIMGLKAYPSAADIPGEFDFAIIMRPAPEVPGILKGLKGKTGCAVIMSSGFAEVGEVELQNEVKRNKRCSQAYGYWDRIAWVSIIRIKGSIFFLSPRRD